MFQGLLVLLVAGGFIFHHYLQFVLVSGDSMAPTFHDGDLILMARRLGRPFILARGDLVIARIGSELWVKRVVGLPGETVEVREGRIYVNGQPTSAAEPEADGVLSLRPGRLGEERYALLGDNRHLPASIAEHAVVSPSQIVGKVIVRILHRS